MPPTHNIDGICSSVNKSHSYFLKKAKVMWLLIRMFSTVVLEYKQEAFFSIPSFQAKLCTVNMCLIQNCLLKTKCY